MFLPTKKLEREIDFEGLAFALKYLLSDLHNKLDEHRQREHARWTANALLETIC